MKSTEKVRSSSQVNLFLPGYIQQNYQTFVEFMTTCAEAQERFGFSSDLLQNLTEYRDFDTYKSDIVTHNFLKFNLKDDGDELELNDGFGFPESNGAVLIDEEVILYREREGNKLTGLLRGASGTTKLPSYDREGEFLDTTPRRHVKETRVENLSSLFLSAILENIHQSFTEGITSEMVSSDVNRSNLLQQIRGFFQSKGTKLGIKSLFKMLFSQNDVDVEYPGDLMQKPSTSTWTEDLIVRTVPVPDVLCELEVLERYQLPDSLIGQKLKLRSYNDRKIYAKCDVEYVTSYAYNSETQYELTIQDDFVKGDILANPNTVLTRDLERPETTTNNIEDVFTVTVETTLGFPESGVIIIDEEAIYYGRKTFNQFHDCRRGHIGVSTLHEKGSKVYGPYYLESLKKEGELVYKTRSFPLGLVKRVDIREEGLLYTKDDEVILGGPGRVDGREPILSSVIENYDDVLTTTTSNDLDYVGNITHGVSGIYFDKEHVFIASSNFPSYSIGTFSTDNSVGPTISTTDALHVIPRRETIKSNDFIEDKGTSKIGVFVDGVPAYSNVSPNKIVQGKIVRYEIISGGSNYQNPTIIITPNNSQAKPIVDKGVIVGVENLTVGDYYGDPQLEVTSGTGAEFELTFDLYGRVETVSILDGGEYYNDAPSLNVVDPTGRGRGAVLQCEVSGGQVTGVNIVHRGIDYSATDTYVFTNPIGSGAIIQPIVEYYRFNRYDEVLNNPNWTFDKGNGFLWENAAGTKEQYGYICSPSQLRGDLQDDGSKHSPILGWAFDGNPIYGPFGYSNGRNDKEGIERQESGYYLLSNRSGINASGGDINNIGHNPPDVAEYPMGSFVEDYRYVRLVTLTENALQTELYEDLQNENYETLLAGLIDGNRMSRNIYEAVGYLDSNNGKVCNTPEFPESLYPDGVYCYFLTVDSGGNPEFPYVIGRTFTNLPISQRVDLYTLEEISPLLSTSVFDPNTYDDTPLSFDFTKVERYRNPYLLATEDQLDVRIADVTTGGISEVICEYDLNLPIKPNTKVGDLTYVDNSPTGGDGFQGVVVDLAGEKVKSAASQRVIARHITHRQVIDLSMNTQDTFVFVRGSIIETSSGARAKVKKYDAPNKLLTVQTITPNLILFDDTFLDNRGVLVTAPSRSFFDLEPIDFYSIHGELPVITTATNEEVDTEEPELVIINPEINTQVVNKNNMTIVGMSIPAYRPDGTPLKDGDLWWSVQNGRMYVYYVSAGGSKKWVCTQPLGMWPLKHSTDLSFANDSPSGNVVYHEQVDNTITISEKAPSDRPDGSPLQLGDLWWSPHTGALYIYNSDFILYVLQYYLQTGELPTQAPGPEWDLTREWVCTDPAGIVSHRENALDEVYPAPFGIGGTRAIYTGELTVIISENAPTVDLDGNPVSIGMLWWSNKTGKMYIYFQNEWVVCNPSSSVNGVYSIDGISIEGGSEVIPPGGGSEIIDTGDAVGLRSELRGQKLLWLTDYEHFLPGDLVEIAISPLGQGNEVVQIEEVREADSIYVERAFNGNNFLVPNLIMMVNISRCLYEVTTETPHHLQVGDTITMHDSEFPAINGDHEVAVTGTVRNAVIRAFPDPSGSITSAVIVDPGHGYVDDFFPNVVGGGGTDAQLFCTILPTEAGGIGEVVSVEIRQGGVNYTDEPTIITDPLFEKPDTYFAFYTDDFHGRERSQVRYTTRSENAIAPAATINVLAPGVGYSKLPEVVGLIKREIDRAEVTVTLNGTSVGSVIVDNPGNRYVNPEVIFVDKAGNGSGARARVNLVNTTVESIDVLDGGSGYTEPTAVLVERGERIFCTTDTIGKIKSLEVMNPGRNISPDRSLKPELQIDTRCLIDYTYDTTGEFSNGMYVWQGDDVLTLADAEVLEYDQGNQTLHLRGVNGTIKEGEIIRNASGIKAMVITCKQADTSVVVDGESKPYGRFVDETSFVSSAMSYIQDSEYYQHFSYVIASPMQQKQYENFVRNIIHPSGFAQFSDLKIRQDIRVPINVIETNLDLDAEVVRVAGPDNYRPTTILEADHPDKFDHIITWDTNK